MLAAMAAMAATVSMTATTTTTTTATTTTTTTTMMLMMMLMMLMMLAKMVISQIKCSWKLLNLKEKMTTTSLKQPRSWMMKPLLSKQNRKMIMIKQKKSHYYSKNRIYQ